MGCCRQRNGWGDRLAVRAAMCLACPKAQAGRRRREPVACTIDGRRLRQRVADPRAKCERWPDGLGRVRWLGVLWVGVPMPLRAWLEMRGHPGAWELPGCGCLAWLHGYWVEEEETWAWERIGRDLAGWVRRLATGETPACRNRCGCSPQR